MSLSPPVQDLSLSPRPSRLGLLARSREALKAFALMTLALLTLGLLCAPPAQAQGGWAVNDKNGNSITPDSSGYPLKGIPTGSANNTYPADMTAAAVAAPYYDPTYGQWVNNSQWLQADSGGPHSYDPNPLGASYLYTGGPGPLSTSIALNATAGNVAGNNYSGAFNRGRPPFFTDYMYQNTSDCEPLQGSATGAVQGTLWAYWTWTGSGQAPNHLNILLTTRVEASSSFNYGNSGLTGGLTATAQASDGNPFNESASVGGVPLVIGHHLLRVPVTGGVAPVSLNGNVQGSASNSVPYGAFGSPYYTNYYGATNGPTDARSIASVSGTAAIDGKNREVHIMPPLGTTFHKGANAEPVPNSPDPYTGTLTDDTVVPPIGPVTLGSGYTISYRAVAGGAWNPNSSYTWSQGLQGASGMGSIYDSASAQGTLPSSNITPPFTVTYGASSRLMGVARDHISIIVTDSGDGATASDDYFLNFHNEYDQIVGTGQTLGSWTRVTPAINPGPNGDGMAFPYPIETSVSVTVSVTPSGAAGNYIAASYGVTDLGATYNSTVPRSVPYIMSADKYCWVEDQPQWLQITGTADNYEDSGYQSQIPFTLNKAFHSSSPLIDFNERFRVSDNPPAQ